MPIKSYDGMTFVAFTDISGFKSLMNEGNKAVEALDYFYSIGFSTLKNQSDETLKVEGFFVSDCGVLFVRKEHNDSIEKALEAILNVLQKMNRKMLEKDYMLTTSIAFGNFKYEEKIEFIGIDKNPIYGNAYLAAFLDNEIGRPKLEPSQCRIIKRDLESLDLNKINVSSKLKERNKGYYYFYWMVDKKDEINNFEKDFKDSYNLKYRGMLKALKKIRK